MIVWLNDELIEESKARIAPDDRGFLLGDGIFETILVRDGKAVFLTQHMERLSRGAALLGFDMPIGASDVQRAIQTLLDANQLATASRAAVRLTLTRGSGPRGIAPPPNPSPSLLIACFASHDPPQQVSVITSAIRRNEFSPTAQIKALPYLDQILAKREAAAAGAHDALMLNTQGKLACATAANLFLWDSDTLITPPLGDGCLDGITRRTILTLAKQTRVGCFEESITPSTLAGVESGFLCNSLVGLQSLTEIDGRRTIEHRYMPGLRQALLEAERASTGT